MTSETFHHLLDTCFPGSSSAEVVGNRGGQEAAEGDWELEGAGGAAREELAVSQGQVSVTIHEIPGRYHVPGGSTLEE